MRRLLNSKKTVLKSKEELSFNKGMQDRSKESNKSRNLVSSSSHLLQKSKSGYRSMPNKTPPNAKCANLVQKGNCDCDNNILYFSMNNTCGSASGFGANACAEGGSCFRSQVAVSERNNGRVGFEACACEWVKFNGKSAGNVRAKTREGLGHADKGNVFNDHVLNYNKLHQFQKTNRFGFNNSKLSRNNPQQSVKISSLLSQVNGAQNKVINNYLKERQNLVQFLKKNNIKKNIF
jgi:hypothetical protein